MLSLGLPWQAALCWAAALSTSSALLGQPHPPHRLLSSWNQWAQKQVGKDIARFHSGHKG